MADGAPVPATPGPGGNMATEILAGLPAPGYPKEPDPKSKKRWIAHGVRGVQNRLKDHRARALARKAKKYGSSRSA
jgi:hypothetical protein